VDLQKYWRIILAHRAMIVILSLSSLTVSILLTYVLPEKYRATSVVLVRPQEKLKLAQNTAAKEILDYPVSQLAPIDAPSKTYIAVIQSRAVVEKIVMALHLHMKPRVPSHDYYKELWLQFKDQVKDLLEWTESIVKYGRVEDEDPLAKAIKTVTKNLSLKATKDTYVFEITHEAGDPQEAADVANMAAEIFTEYMASANRQDSSSVREFLESRLRNSERELMETRQALSEFKEGHGTFSLSEEYSAKLKIIGDLETDLGKTDSKLAGLVEIYTDSHPKVRSLLAEKERLTRSLSQLKKDLEVHPDKEKQLEKLKLRLKVVEENYELVNKSYEEARIEEAKRLSEIRIISPAVAPIYPAKPIKYYYAGGGLSVALFIGVALAIFLETQRARIRSIEDVAATLQLPVLATIPFVKTLDK
jgi:uncharacterized protein involved in exopolysaccharide biosynthesis